MKNFDKEDAVRKIFEQEKEILELFCKTFIVTEVKDYEHFRTGSLELVKQLEGGSSLNCSYRCQFIPYDELEKKKKTLVKEVATRELLRDVVRYTGTEDLIAELKKRGLGVFNLSLPFVYKPKDEESH